MSGRRTIGVTFWVMIFLQALGGIDFPKVVHSTDPNAPPGALGPVSVETGRKLPSPRLFVPVVVLWGILGIVAETSASAERLAAKLAGLVLLTGALLGPFGTRAISFLNTIARDFAIQGPATAPSFDQQASAPTAIGALSATLEV